MVHETAKSTPLNCLRNSLTSVLLPEPEGAEIIKRIPATYRYSLPPKLRSRSLSTVSLFTVHCSLFTVHYPLPSLQVLNLFPSLLDLRLHRQPQFGNARAFPAHPACL